MGHSYTGRDGGKVYPVQQTAPVITKTAAGAFSIAFAGTTPAYWNVYTAQSATVLGPLVERVSGSLTAISGLTPVTFYRIIGYYDFLNPATLQSNRINI